MRAVQIKEPHQVHHSVLYLIAKLMAKKDVAIFFIQHAVVLMRMDRFIVIIHGVNIKRVFILNIAILDGCVENFFLSEDISYLKILENQL